MTTVAIYDTTLRDGCQGAGLALSLQDKLDVARRLDELGVGWIEGGWPGSNPQDAQVFPAVREAPRRRGRSEARADPECAPRTTATSACSWRRKRRR